MLEDVVKKPIMQKSRGKCFVCGHPARLANLCTNSHDTPAGHLVETVMCDDHHACYARAHSNANRVYRSFKT